MSFHDSARNLAMRLLITGASGVIGSSLRDRLADCELMLTDVVELPNPLRRNERFVSDATSDVDFFSEVAEGCDLVVHLGWVREPRQSFDVLQQNIAITNRVLEGTLRAGVDRFLFASSNHAVGYTPIAELKPTTDVARMAIRPDDFYGVAKAACEALCAFYADEYAMSIVSARLLSFRSRPGVLRELSTWLSPDDMARLIRAAAKLDSPGHHVCWGVSRNTAGWANLEPGMAVGFDPQDDARPYSKALLDAATNDDVASLTSVGGRDAPRARIDVENDGPE